MEQLPLAQKLQSIEAYLTSLVDSLQQGKFPVNIKKISQVFDKAIIELPRLSLPPEKFCNLYNDIPTILSAYAITVTLNADSYDRTNSKQIVFERLYNGNYWIIPLAVTPDHAWLVPNPTRKINLARLDSLAFAFDWEKPANLNDQATFLLIEPALVSVLPTEPLSWKLIGRGAVGSFVNADVKQQDRAVNVQIAPDIDRLVEQAVKARFDAVKTEMFALLMDQIKAEVPNLSSGSIIELPTPSNVLNIPTPIPSQARVVFPQLDLTIIPNGEGRSIFSQTTEFNPPALAIPQVAQEIQQQIADDFQYRYNDFFSKYQPKPVSVDENSIDQTSSIDEQIITLIGNDLGRYWIIERDNISYLVMAHERFFSTVKYPVNFYLFNCRGCISGYRTIQLVKPAIVIVSSPSKWQLQDKGKLSFR